MFFPSMKKKVFLTQSMSFVSCPTAIKRVTIMKTPESALTTFLKFSSVIDAFVFFTIRRGLQL
jgi:hypothetical protein